MCMAILRSLRRRPLGSVAMGPPGDSGVFIFISGVVLAHRDGPKAGPVFGVGWGVWGASGSTGMTT